MEEISKNLHLVELRLAAIEDLGLDTRALHEQLQLARRHADEGRDGAATDIAEQLLEVIGRLVYGREEQSFQTKTRQPAVSLEDLALIRRSSSVQSEEESAGTDGIAAKVLRGPGSEPADETDDVEEPTSWHAAPKAESYSITEDEAARQHSTVALRSEDEGEPESGALSPVPEPAYEPRHPDEPPSSTRMKWPPESSNQPTTKPSRLNRPAVDAVSGQLEPDSDQSSGEVDSPAEQVQAGQSEPADGEAEGPAVPASAVAAGMPPDRPAVGMIQPVEQVESESQSEEAGEPGPRDPVEQVLADMQMPPIAAGSDEPVKPAADFSPEGVAAEPSDSSTASDAVEPAQTGVPDSPTEQTTPSSSPLAHASEVDHDQPVSLRDMLLDVLRNELQTVTSTIDGHLEKMEHRLDEMELLLTPTDAATGSAMGRNDLVCHDRDFEHQASEILGQAESMDHLEASQTGESDSADEENEEAVPVDVTIPVDLMVEHQDGLVAQEPTAAAAESERSEEESSDGSPAETTTPDAAPEPVTLVTSRAPVTDDAEQQGHAEQSVAVMSQGEEQAMSGTGDQQAQSQDTETVHPARSDDAATSGTDSVIGSVSSLLNAVMADHAKLEERDDAQGAADAPVAEAAAKAEAGQSSSTSYQATDLGEVPRAITAKTPAPTSDYEWQPDESTTGLDPSALEVPRASGSSRVAPAVSDTGAINRSELKQALIDLMPEVLRDRRVQQQIFALIATEALLHPSVLGELTGLRQFLRKEIQRAVEESDSRAASYQLPRTSLSG